MCSGLPSLLKLYLFGDQTYDIRPHLKLLLRERDNPILENYFSKAYDAIRSEIYQLPPQIRDDLPRFTCFNDLVLQNSSQNSYIPLDMAITCLYQLGAFIREADTHFEANVKYIGICTGALTAAAVTCSRSSLDLIPKAIETIVVAFRIGMHVTDVAKRITPPDESGKCWSIIIPGSSSSEAINKFCEGTLLPLTGRPYISARAPNGITVSGPPGSLEQLVNSEAFKGLKSKSIPIYGPYHAPHLHSQSDVSDIVGSLTSNRVTLRSQHAVSPPSMEEKIESSEFRALLEAAVGQILLHPVLWSDVLEELKTWIQNLGSKSINIVPIGTTADQLIHAGLRQTLSTLTSFTSALQGPANQAESSYSNVRKPKLAIVGMSGRFPGAKDNDAFWDLLYQGLDVHKPVPGFHWDAKTHVDPTQSRKNTSGTPFGCWLDDPAGFDARFFNISPREAPQIDPAQRLALMTAYEAIEQAGIVPNATPSTRSDRVGVFYGVTSNDWMETNSAQNIDTYFIPGGNRAFIPGRINYYFKFSGPSYAVDTACSSSLAAIHLACNSLWQKDVDTAIAGGTNVLTNPDFTAGLDRGHFLSRTGNCKTFDEEADGYCRGEGIGTVIIKRLDDALEDDDPILGVILGASTNHSAESESITRPHIGAQRAIFNEVLNQGAVDSQTVGYIEMHGTGTQAGDAREMASVLETFAPPLSQAKRARDKDEALYLGSVRANIGHGEAASGVSSLIKVLLMMQKNMIVPHCGIKTIINRKFPTDLHERNVHIASKPIPWERSPDPSKLRRAFVNNFSAAGGNSTLLLEDRPLKHNSATESSTDPRDIHLVAISAKNAASLQGNLKSMLRFLKQNPHVSLGQISYTTTARRMHHQHRVMLAGANVEDIGSQIEVAIQNNTGMTRPKSSPNVVFVFTGQGAQYPGMGKQLYEGFSVFRNEMRRLDRIGKSLGFSSMLPVIQSDERDISIFPPTTVQLANVCMQIALGKMWARWNITPTAVVGHSLGEYAALNIAGVLSDADTIYLVGKRCNLLEKRCTIDTHAMLVVKGSVDEISEVLKDKAYEIACINSPVETVLAGSNENIAGLKETLTGSNMKCTLLKVPYAFHSSQIIPILDDFEGVARGVRFSKAKIPIICPLDGNISQHDADFGPEYLANHSRKTVNMFKALLEAHSNRIITDQTTILEIGPHPAISGMVKAVLGPRVACLASLQRGRSTWQVLGAALKFLYGAGSDINWKEYSSDFKDSHEVISLPAYSWDLKEYWIQYVNDWSLRKGDPLPAIENRALTPKSTTIHRVVEETHGPQKTHIVVETNIARDDLSPLVQGHEVDGIPLCTPSVYADVALGLGTYILQRYCPDQREDLIDVSEMNISKALILRAGATQQLLQAHAEVDWPSQSMPIKFMTFDNKQKLQEHSRCIVRFKDRSLREVLQSNSESVKLKLQALRDGIATGMTARFNRPMVYRSIRPLARFHDDYRAINEVVLNSNTLEASSHLSFDKVKKGGNFHTHPAIIDSLTQSCGFAMNCNDNTDLDVEVFMNHGWGSLQIFEPMDFDKQYSTYTRMEEGPNKLWFGDVVIFEGDRVIAYFGQVAIQGVPRRILKVILSIENGDKSQKQQKLAQKKQAAPTPAAMPQVASPTAREGSRSSKIDNALLIIAEESGLSTADLTDNTVFSDVGVDSLLGLSISARFKDELDIDEEFSSLFYDYPTVGSLRAFLEECETTGVAMTSTSRSSDSHGSTTPATTETGITMSDIDDRLPASGVNFQRALQIVSEETGIAIEDLVKDMNFADSGVDSLLTLVIVSRFRDELQLDIQHDSLFLECPTVADLEQLLLGSTDANTTVKQTPEESEVVPISSEVVATFVEDKTMLQSSEGEENTLAARKKAVDDYVRHYTDGLLTPGFLHSAATPSDGEKVVVVTGASGSLGSHLVYHMAQLPDVKTVICLNRDKKIDPFIRQQKAMREKGIRFPEDLKSKLLVLQTDCSRPMLGLSVGEYEVLVNSATHLVHSAWPMSAKRHLAGFESQFQIMRSLIDFAYDVASRRPESFKFSFQMISSIGVVGRYGLEDGNEKTVVPEEKVGIESVLPNGYGDAKWGCERMLDETLHKHPHRFRTMAVRLGQIAGSKTSGYWNPMEHFGFLVKSSQTLNALPDVDGTVYWTPVNDIAGALSDLVLSNRDPYPIYHIENPVGQPWREMNAILADALNITDLIPFEKWVERVRVAPQRNNPAATLLEFLSSNYLRMSCGGLVLDVKKTLEHSKTLTAVGPVKEDVIGFLG
ncbi:beta-ketoacyl synthase [Annulohypoxylon moriforme]|nr:beta-ketoacyl synthase [Annulohypoxylon moriforme]